ncbi:MAG: MBL fold metallo-hydrolase [Desulfurococcaceae archaeon]
MKIKLIAFDSMGVRSMATVVETNEGLIFIDPGAALAPVRYGFPPHELEYKLLSTILGRIHEKAVESDYIIITHYHRDHYLFRNEEKQYYRGKVVYAKNPHGKINYSQRIRAYILFKKMNVESIVKKLSFVDNSVIQINSIKLIFSPPLPHGECGTKLGWVLAVTVIEDDYKFMFASDTQGCICSDSLNYVLELSPDFLVISGPPTYLHGGGLPGNTIKLVEGLKEKSILIIDHHFLRDKNYLKHMEYLRKIRSDLTITTAAEYMGFEIKQLEAYRDELWKK